MAPFLPGCMEDAIPRLPWGGTHSHPHHGQQPHPHQDRPHPHQVVDHKIYLTTMFQVRSVQRNNWNIYRHFPRCALDIIEVRLKNNYLRMGMVKVALVFPLLRLNRLELSLPPNYNFLTPRHCPKLFPKVDLLPQLYNTNRLFQLTEWQITRVESWIGYINWIYSWVP